jgi:hypothetical protein
MEGTRYRRLRRTCVAIRAESATAGRRPSFRGMSATDSETAPKSGRIPVGISGRVPVGMGGRLASESVAGMGRNTQWSGVLMNRLIPRSWGENFVMIFLDLSKYISHFLSSSCDDRQCLIRRYPALCSHFRHSHSGTGCRYHQHQPSLTSA